jgi:hypothetical protein
MAQENGTVCQQVRDFESRLCDKEQTLLSGLHHSFELDQELVRQRILLQMAEEATKVKADEFEEFQTAKNMEIQNMQVEMEELEEEVQDHGVTLAK